MRENTLGQGRGPQRGGGQLKTHIPWRNDAWVKEKKVITGGRDGSMWGQMGGPNIHLRGFSGDDRSTNGNGVNEMWGDQGVKGESADTIQLQKKAGRKGKDGVLLRLPIQRAHKSNRLRYKKV